MPPRTDEAAARPVRPATNRSARCCPLSDERPWPRPTESLLEIAASCCVIHELRRVRGDGFGARAARLEWEIATQLQRTWEANILLFPAHPWHNSAPLLHESVSMQL